MYIFFWKKFAGLSSKDLTKEVEVVMPYLGEGSRIMIDGRWGTGLLKKRANQYAKERDAIGYSIGRLVSDDPYNKHKQSKVKFTMAM